MAWFDCCWSGWWCRFNGNTCYIVFSFCFALDQMGNPLVLHGVSYMVIEPRPLPNPNGLANVAIRGVFKIEILKKMTWCLKIIKELTLPKRWKWNLSPFKDWKLMDLGFCFYFLLIVSSLLLLFWIGNNYGAKKPNSSIWGPIVISIFKFEHRPIKLHKTHLITNSHLS